ncbi:MAG: hypothetical protein J2P25_02585 [Nocardiopsaceae bacterium]|nr:hypothetical protein [Nocardiopsaceae bacterium]
MPDELWRIGRRGRYARRFQCSRIMRRTRRRHEASRRVVVGAHQPGDRHQPVLVGDPRRARTPGYLTLDEGEYLAPAVIDSQEPWRAVEADALKVLQQRVHQRRVLSRRPSHGVPHPDDALGHVPAGQRHLKLTAIVSPHNPSARPFAAHYSIGVEFSCTIRTKKLHIMPDAVRFQPRFRPTGHDTPVE